jgi:hypothetical protein
VATILGSELAFYFFVKLMRRDFRYWLALYGPSGVFAAFMMRWIIKLVGDWTGVVQFRHPNEIGGAYFTFTLGVTIAIGIFAALGYKKEEGEGILEETTVFWVMLTACIGIFISYLSLLLSINREYLHTFTSMQTSNEYLAKEFKGSEQDEGKMDIFRTNRLKWKKVLGNEVDTWLNERLPVWLEEDVEWLTDEMMSIIPGGSHRGADGGRASNLHILTHLLPPQPVPPLARQMT